MRPSCYESRGRLRLLCEEFHSEVGTQSDYERLALLSRRIPLSGMRAALLLRLDGFECDCHLVAPGRNDVGEGRTIGGCRWLFCSRLIDGFRIREQSAFTPDRDVLPHFLPGLISNLDVPALRRGERTPRERNDSSSSDDNGPAFHYTPLLNPGLSGYLY